MLPECWNYSSAEAHLGGLEMQAIREITTQMVQAVDPEERARTLTRGSPRQELELGDVCPACGGSGWVKLDVPVDDARFGKMVRCTCGVARADVSAMVRRRAEAWGMTVLERMTFESFNASVHPSVEQAFSSAQAFARNPFRCLMLWGGFGSGKSHLCTAIVNVCVEVGTDVLAFTAPDFLDLLRSGYDSGDYERLLGAAKNVRVLVLDDLGSEKGTEWGQEKLFQVIDYRYRELMPLVLSSNVNPATFPGRLADRLCDERWSLRVHINAPSYRRRKA